MGAIVVLVLVVVGGVIAWQVLRPREKTLAQTLVARLRPGRTKPKNAPPAYRISHPRAASKPQQLALLLVASAAQLLLAKYFFTDPGWAISAVVTSAATFVYAIGLLWSQYRYFHARRDTVVEDGTVRVYEKNELVQSLPIARITSARLVERTSRANSDNTVVFLEVEVAVGADAIETVKFTAPEVEPKELYEALDKHIKAANS